MKKFKVVHYVYERDDSLNDANEIASIRSDKQKETVIKADSFVIEGRILLFKEDLQPCAAFSSWESVNIIE